MRGIVVPDVKRTYREDEKENPMAKLHITPPLTSPSGPVHFNEANAQLRSAIMPTTVNVIANAKTNG
jgi:hypothetical protein